MPWTEPAQLVAILARHVFRANCTRRSRKKRKCKTLPTCIFCASTEHTKSACPFAVNKFTFPKASSQWSKNGFDLVDVPGDGNCFFHGSIPLADFMHKDSRDDKALEMRVLLCSEVVGKRERYEINVFHAANQDRQVNRKKSSSTLRRGMKLDGTIGWSA
jgi:hypothetical protein